MTNWPNIQEYRNLEAKFIDDPKPNVLIDSDANSDLVTVIKEEYTAKNNADDFNSQKLQNTDSKIVRCVIKKDFEEAFKKVEREDGVSSNHEYPRPKPQDSSAVNRSHDKIRLQNHLKWKKQKEEEYLQKKEAEKVAQMRKKEEEQRLDKMKKEKEKEKMEKLKEWQEQKARQKEEKKKEKMMIKMLGEELKVTPTVDKEKLIEEWVKLKNKQKQMEAEKKAELLKKEEESRALRQTLAELSYRQWKERIKGRMMTLPKNGYQIFGPKPVPVVKEDWNHDFTQSSPRSSDYSLRNTESCSTTFLTLCPPVKELENFPKDIFYLGNLKSNSSSLYQLNKIKSRSNLRVNREDARNDREMPLKELQPSIIDLKKNGTNLLKNKFQKSNDFPPEDFNSEMNFLSKCNTTDNQAVNHVTDFMCFPGAQGDQIQCFVSPQKKLLNLLKNIPDAQILPNKKKIDLYINTCPNEVEENPVVKVQKKKTPINDSKIQKEEKKEKVEKPLNQTARNISREKLCPKSRTRSLSLQKFEKNANENSRTSVKKSVEQDNMKVKVCRRSHSCEKPLKKPAKNAPRTKDCSASKSMVKVTGETNESHKTLSKSKTNCSQKSKTRKADPSQLRKVAHSKSEKKLWEHDHKMKKKIKKKTSLSKSFSYTDSPYSAKITSKTLTKVKTNRHRNKKDAESKSDDGGRCRKLSTTKI